MLLGVAGLESIPGRVLEVLGALHLLALLRAHLLDQPLAGAQGGLQGGDQAILVPSRTASWAMGRSIFITGTLTSLA